MTAEPIFWFDVEDLLHHFETGHKHPTGIQRLTFEVYQAAQKTYGSSGRLRFVRHSQIGERRFVPVAWDSLNRANTGNQDAPTFRRPASIRAHTMTAATPISSTRIWDRRAFAWLPLRLRRPLVLGVALEVRALLALARFAAALVLQAIALCVRTLRAGSYRQPVGTDVGEMQPGDILLTLGSPWFCRDYDRLVRWARDVKRLRFGVLIHDLIPINHPEWCDAGVIETFRRWHESVLPLCDFVLANSQYTATQVELWAARAGVRLNGPVRPVPIGTGFGGEPIPVGATLGLPRPGSYILFVSTLEARKNHTLLVRVWRRLLEEEFAGKRPAGSVPDLVFAGRVGWLVDDLMQQLENSSWLDGRVRLLRDPSDAELRALYEGALFSIFPSLYEGWGLPVTEALAFGVPVLCSSATALPEAGGDLARYFDPEDAGGCCRAVAALIDDRAELEAWRADVRTRFRPTPWSATARAVLAEGLNQGVVGM